MPIALALAALASTADLSAGLDQGNAAFGRPLPAAEIGRVRGSYLPLVGLDLAGPAASAYALPVPAMQFPSVAMREITDNWNLTVATPLIAAALRAGG